MAGKQIPTHEAHLFGAPLEACPSCGSTALEPVIDDAAVHFFCTDCARCWHVELGAVWRVDPHSCAGCDHYQKCVEVYAADHAAQTPGDTAATR